MSYTMTVPASLSCYNQVLGFVEEKLEEKQCPISINTKINIAIDEIFTNIVTYAYPKKEGEVSLTIEFSENPKAVILSFQDSGIPYNPLEKPDPDVTLSAEERNIGGLGIFIVKKSMDEIEYAYENGKNILTLHKYY